ncbi:histidine phosphatase family protein [Ilumatobacter sp.]|uniref:histidine phosphatase family protein n=1 Tax=Ilumatobacter sp. TaxID=1967498 RepID=UPI003B51800D
MELLLIRHGLPVRRELTEGRADPELSEEGRQQAEHLRQYLSSEQLDAVYASSLARAVQTAEPLVVDRDLELVVEPDVAEYDRDSPEYVPVEELRAANDPRWRAMLDGTWQEQDEGTAEFGGRVLGAIARIVERHRSQRVAVVCHGGVINAYLVDVLGLPADSRGFFYPNYTSIHRVAAASSGERSIVTVNETSHLRGTGLPMGIFQGG